MKILLILACSDVDPLRNLDPFMPLIFPILASASPEHDYTFIDLLRESESSLRYDENYDLAGISYRVSAKTRAYAIADHFRANNTPVVLGGPQASTLPFEAMEHADAVVVGEGEKLWQILLDDMEKNDLKRFYVSSPADFDPQGYSCHHIKDFSDLTNIPLIRRDIIKAKYFFDVIYAARGCPVDCSFCSVSKLFGKKIRLRKINDVIAEIDTLKRKFYLVDDTVFGRPVCYNYYLELYQKIQRLKKKRFWAGQANLDAAADPKGRQVIAEAAKAGFAFASIGIETINPDDQKNTGVDKKLGITGKSNIRRQLKNNISFIQKQGTAISGWFAIGLENDTIQSCLDTLQFCFETNIFPVFSPVQVFEGTRLYEQLKEKNKLKDRNSNVTNIKHPNLSNEDLIFILKTAWEKGYSIKAIIRRTFFYGKIFNRLKRGHFDFVYRLMFTIVAQRRLRKIQKHEIRRFEKRIEAGERCQMAGNG